MKKTICVFLLIITMCAAFTPNASAAQFDADASVQRWTYIISITNDLTISGGVAKMKVSVYCDTSITRIEVTARLQKQSGSSWTPVATYYATYYTYYGTSSWTRSGCTGPHRLMTTVTVYEGSTLRESATVYTYAG